MSHSITLTSVLNSRPHRWPRAGQLSVRSELHEKLGEAFDPRDKLRAGGKFVGVMPAIQTG